MGWDRCVFFMAIVFIVDESLDSLVRRSVYKFAKYRAENKTIDQPVTDKTPRGLTSDCSVTTIV